MASRRSWVATLWIGGCFALTAGAEESAPAVSSSGTGQPVLLRPADGRYQFDEPVASDPGQVDEGVSPPDRSADVLRALQRLSDTQIPLIRRLVDETRVQVEALRGEFTARYGLLDEAVEKARGDLAYLRESQRAPVTAPTAPAFSAGSANSAQNAAASVPGPSKAGEAEAYRAAFEEILAGNLPEAAQRLDEFVARYPSGRLSAGAWYWLGEVNLRLGRDALARRALEQLLRDHPGHPTVPDALYRLATIHEAAGETAEAGAYRRRLAEEFPDSAAAMQAREGVPLHP